MDSTSVSLLRRLREPAADEAWRRFVDLYAPLIFYWGLHQGLNPTDAADLVQDVLAVLVVKLPEFEYDPARRFRGWLRTVTLNRARDLHRKNSRHPATGMENSLQSVAVGAAVDLFEEAEYQSFLVNRALELMRTEFKEDTWRACWRQVVEGRKAADVAQELGLSLNAVYLAKSRVLGAFWLRPNKPTKSGDSAAIACWKSWAWAAWAWCSARKTPACNAPSPSKP